MTIFRGPYRSLYCINKAIYIPVEFELRSNLMTQLPSLRALSTLEAVVRTGNIIAAAKELCVTPGAVSKQLNHLQQALDAPLFEKGHRLRPTPLAVELAQGIGVGLRQMRDAWGAVTVPSTGHYARREHITVCALDHPPPCRRSGRNERPAGAYQHPSLDRRLGTGAVRYRDRASALGAGRLGEVRYWAGTSDAIRASPDAAATLRNAGPVATARMTCLVAHTRPGELKIGCRSLEAPARSMSAARRISISQSRARWPAMAALSARHWFSPI